MKIPVPVVLGISLATVAVAWWLGTRDKDFMTPRGEQFALADLSPGFAAPEAEPPRAVVPVNLEPEDRNQGGPTPSRGADYLELGDLATSPGLSEYSEHASKGPEYLTKLATELESRGEFQRALLAWERILDSCAAESNERSLASAAVARIRPTLPRWNIDPIAALPLTLEIGSTRPESPELREAAARIEKFLETDSGDQIEIVTRITANTASNAPANGPIGIAISGSNEDSEGASLVRSSVPADNESATIYRALLAEAYLLVGSHLATLPQCKPPRPPAYPDDPERDFHFQITRLHWNSFARSLTPELPTDIPRADLPDEE